MEDLWTAFLTPPRGNLLSLCRVMMDHDQRFPANFIPEFIELFKRLRGWNPTDDPANFIPEFIELFKRLRGWNPTDDPDYEVPRNLMKTLYEHERDKMKKKERKQRQKQKEKVKEMEIEEVPTAQEIEENKKKMSKRFEVYQSQYVESQKSVVKSYKLGRKVTKLSATVTNTTNQGSLDKCITISSLGKPRDLCSDGALPLSAEVQALE